MKDSDLTHEEKQVILFLKRKAKGFIDRPELWKNPDALYAAFNMAAEHIRAGRHRNTDYSKSYMFDKENEE